MDNTYLAHHGVKGQKWGVRRYQNSDGSLTTEGKKRYGKYGEKLINKIEYDRKHHNISPKNTIRDENINNLKNLGKRWLIAAGVSVGVGAVAGAATGLSLGLGSPYATTIGKIAYGTAMATGLAATGYNWYNIGSTINRTIKVSRIANDYDIPDADIRVRRT